MTPPDWYPAESSELGIWLALLLPVLRRRAQRFTTRYEIGEDAVGWALARAWERGLPRFGTLPHLWTTVRRRIKELVRNEHSSLRVLRRYSAHWALPAPGPDEDLLRNERLRHLDGLTAKLDQRDHDITQLYHSTKEMTQRQVADAFGVNRATVNRTLKRVHESLNSQFQREGA